MSALAGRAALVTGASSGIGRAVALALTQAGANVCLSARNAERLAAAAEECCAANVAVRAADLTEQTDVEGLAAFVADRFGRLDVLVHGAGAIVLGRMADSSLEDLDRVIAANVTAPYALTRALLPELVRNAGDVVFLNSTITRYPTAHAGQYGLTKHALTGLADSLRQEVNEHGVRVLSVYPGRTATPMQAEIYAYEDRPFKPDALLQAEDVAAIVIHALTLPRTAEVTDIYLRPMQKG